MKSIANHAFYSQYTFFTSFIDQYYVFNFIECHSLLSHGGEKTDTPAIIYSNIQQRSRPENEPSDNAEKLPENEITIKDGQDEISNTEQKVSYYFLTNNEFFSGWSNFIEVYSEINNGSNSLNDGYRVHLAYADSNTSDWGCTNCEFVLAPIDNLKRDGDNQQISEFPEEVTQDSYIPLNLTQTTNHVYLDTDMSSPDNLASMESFVSLGEKDTTNTFKHYYFAKQQNDYQIRCLKKCGLHVRLQNYNPSITKFSRIWVDIFDKNPTSQMKIKPSQIVDSWSDRYKEMLKEKKVIETNFGETLYYDYYEYVIKNRIVKWENNTHILYGENDNVQSYEIIKKFSEKFSCDIFYARNCNHYFASQNEIENYKGLTNISDAY